MLKIMVVYLKFLLRGYLTELCLYILFLTKNGGHSIAGRGTQPILVLSIKEGVTNLFYDY